MGRTTSSSSDSVLDNRLASHADCTSAGFPVPPWLAPGAAVVGVGAVGAVVAPFALFDA